MTYKEQLLDPRWQKKRLKILERDHWQCKSCGDTDSTLHIHHSSYGVLAWEVSDEDLITVCADCHSLKEYMKYNIGIYLKCGKVIKIIRGNGVLFVVSYTDGKEVGFHFFSNIDKEGVNYMLSIGNDILQEIISKLNA